MQKQPPRQKASLRIILLALIVVALGALALSACASAEAWAIPTRIATQPPPARITAVAPLAATATHRPTQTPTTAPTAKNTPTLRPTRTPTVTLAPGSVRVQAGPVQVPILMYHHVSDKINTRYALPVSTFRAQMKYLSEQGYQTVSVSQLAEVIRAGGALPEKAVVITFDDGYLDTYANAYPIMEAYGFTGVVYIITSTFEEGKTYGYMQRPELRALLRAGWEIGSHSVTHTNLKEPKLGLDRELTESKAALERLLGAPVRSFSYPYAVSTEAIRAAVERAGYDSAVGVDILVTNTPKRLYFLSRREVQRGVNLTAFGQLLTPGKDELAWVQEWEAQAAEAGVESSSPTPPSPGR